MRLQKCKDKAIISSGDGGSLVSGFGLLSEYVVHIMPLVHLCPIIDTGNGSLLLDTHVVTVLWPVWM